MNYAECVVHDGKVVCSNDISVEEVNGVLRIYSNVDGPVVFTSKVDVKIVCSGLDFQTFTWGIEKKTLWWLEKGLNTCLIIENAVLEQYGRIIVIRNATDAWSPTMGVLKRADELWKTTVLDRPLFLLSPSFNLNVCYKNIVSAASLDLINSCLERLKRTD